MMGGGFGGCTINIVKEEAKLQLTQTLYTDYKSIMGMEITSYIVKISDGTGIEK
jgi:galactokinase